LSWWTKYGKNEEWFQRLAREGKVTKALKQKPALYDDLLFIWESFLMLSASRQLSQLQPITYQEIEAYCNLCNIPDYERIEFVRWIKFLDNKFLEIKGKQYKAQSAKLQTTKPRRR